MQPLQETVNDNSSLLPHHVLQTILEAPHGNALQACTASILGLPLDSVPNFVAEPDYWAAMLAHARTSRLGLIKLPLTANGQLPYPSAPGTLCLARGKSPRGSQGHVVVAAVATDGVRLTLVHDPWPEGIGLNGPASWAAFYTALAPAAVAKASLLAFGNASDSSASTLSASVPTQNDHTPSLSLASTPRELRVAFIGNSYVYFNDLPRLLEALAGPSVLARTGVCLRGGASLPGLMGSRGGSANVLPGSDVAGVGVGSTPVGSVRDLLLGVEGAPPVDPDIPVSEAALSTTAATANTVEGAAIVGTRDSEVGLWDAVVLNDYSQAAALAKDRAQTEKCLREKYAPLLAAARSISTVIFYVPPAYREHTKGSEEIGSWDDFTRLQTEGHETYRRALEDGLSAAAAAAAATATTSSDGHETPSSGVHVRMADVNAAFAVVRAARSALWHDLFASDNFHPSPTGSFLAAAVILRALVGVQPLPAVAQPTFPAYARTVGDGSEEGGEKEPAEFLFARARRPLADSGQLPSASDMAFLWDIAMRPS